MTKKTQIIIRLIETFQKSQRKSDHETRFWSSIIVPNVSELREGHAAFTREYALRAELFLGWRDLGDYPE